jgi:hypothetical protein
MFDFAKTETSEASDVQITNNHARLCNCAGHDEILTRDWQVFEYEFPCQIVQHNLMIDEYRSRRKAVGFDFESHASCSRILGRA